jgi:hypothetical protein
MTISQSTVDRIRLEYPVCYRCQSSENLEIHHCIYHRQKKFAKWLDREENLIRLCHSCHADHGYVGSYFFRWCVYQDKAKIYDMITWHDSIPMLIKDNFEI